MNTPATIVVAWHDALNAGDVERLVGLSSEDVEVVGPRGSGTGSQLLREWVNRAGIRLQIRRAFHRDDTVVVEEDAQWRSAETGALSESQVVASVFRVRDGRVISVARYADVAAALHAAGLAESDVLKQA